MKHIVFAAFTILSVMALIGAIAENKGHFITATFCAVAALIAYNTDGDAGKSSAS